MKTQTFVSYDHSEDARYKRLLQAWDANPKFDFEFDSRGPNVAIDSEEAPAIKAALTKCMKDSTHFLVLIGAESHSSKWMEWEIKKAKELGLKLVAIKLAKNNESPEGLLGVGTTWATSFTRDQIVKALDEA